MYKILLSILLLLLFFCGNGYGAATYQPGFRTIGVWREGDKIRLDMNIWYPATRAPRELNFSPWIINGAMNAKCATGKFPVLVVSHHTPGNRFSYHELAARLAKEGYFVLAPTHPHDCIDNMDDLYTWRQIEGRLQDIDFALETLYDIPDLKPYIDENKVGIIGFGAGGTVALILGGAVPNCANWHNYCQKATKRDVYCIKWAKERIDEMCLGGYWSGIETRTKAKAVAVINPAYGMLFDKISFEKFHARILLVGVEGDQENRVAFHSEQLAAILGTRAQYLALPEVDMGALMSACPPSLETELPDLCLSVLPEKRQEFQNRLFQAFSAFFEMVFER